MAEEQTPELQASPGRDVFISYASQDKTVADAVCEALEKAGLACWIAPRDVVPGENYAGAIVHAIDATRLIVLVLSEHSADSQHVHREVERASSRRHPVIAFRIDQAPMPAELEYFLNTSQWLDASNTGVKHALPRLVDAIRIASTHPSTGAHLNTGVSTITRASARRSVALVAVTAITMAALAFFAVNKFWFTKRGPSEPRLALASSTSIPDKSIAVLPFADMSEKHDQEYFSDGLSEELIDRLVKVPDLHVPAPTSSFYFKGKHVTITEFAKTLGVAHVLEGSVRKSGNTLRIAAQLIRVSDGLTLWSQTYDRPLADIFKLQDDIANAVVQRLQITLMGGPLTRAKGGTENLEAYQLYLRALRSYRENTPAALKLTREYLEQAIALDKDFGLAWAQDAFVSVLEADSGVQPPTVGYEKGRRLAQRALLASPDLPLAHNVLQYVHRTFDWDWAASAAEGREAHRVDPTNAYATMFEGMLASTLGRWDDAERLLTSAMIRDPLDPFTNSNLGDALYLAGKFAGAEAAYRRVLTLAPDFTWAPSMLACILLAQGKPAAALAILQADPDEHDRLLRLPIVLQANDRQAESDQALATLIAKFANTSAVPIAEIYAYRDDHEHAIEWLERGYKQKDAYLTQITGEPLLKNLAGDPRYKAFVRKMNLPE
jgi:adenylate cyclase